MGKLVQIQRCPATVMGLLIPESDYRPAATTMETLRVDRGCAEAYRSRGLER
jgi:hypothetical protein